MQFEHPLREGQFVARYKRFLADIRLPDGQIVAAHCANPGSMLNCQPDGARVWFSESANPRRKLRYTWELVEVDDTLIVVNTHRANAVVREGIECGVVNKLLDYDTIRPEVTCSVGSRIDFLVTRQQQPHVKAACPSPPCWVEVKSVTLGLGEGLSAFPDSVSSRATRHLHELMALVQTGDRAIMLFACNRADTTRMAPADDLDPVYGATLREAALMGVELVAHRCEITHAGIWLREQIPIEL